MNEVQPPQAPPQMKSGFAGKLFACFGIGCLMAVLLCVGGVYYVYINFDYWTRTAVAFGVEQVSAEMLARAQLPEAEEQGIRQTLDEVARDIRDGEIGMVEAECILDELTSEELASQLFLRSTQAVFTKSMQLSDEQKAQAIATFDRFIAALQSGKLNASSLAGIVDHDPIEQVQNEMNDPQLAPLLEALKPLLNPAPKDTPNRTFFAENLDTETLVKALQDLRGIADDLGITQSATTKNLPQLVREAIQRGKDNAAERRAAGETDQDIWDSKFPDTSTGGG